MEYIKFKKGSPYPEKRGGSTLHCVAKNKFILIGGGNRSKEFGDIWELSILDNNECEWKQINIPLSAFTPRTGHTSSQVDESTIYIYGGQNFTENKHYNDFLKLDLDTNSLQRLNKSSGALNLNEPTERNSSTLVYNNIDKQLLLFGGADPQEPLRDLYVYDILLGKWTKVETKNGDEIKGLEMHTAHFYSAASDLKKKKKKKGKSKKGSNIVNLDIGDFTKEVDSQGQAIPHEAIMNIPKVNIEFDEKNAIVEDDNNDEIEEFPHGDEQIIGKEEQEEEQKNEDNKQGEQQKQKYMIVIGGRYLDQVKSEIYSLNLSNYEWKRIKDLPFEICAHTSTVVEDSIYIFGGTSGQEFYDKLYIFQLTNQKLYEFEITPQEKKQCMLTPRMASAMSYDQESKKLYIFGGASIEDETTALISINTNKINTSNRTKKI
ncbi:kelch motif protein (macronuclear) [Tetrahymena thermophila SB210]|uniref:Kelch motif protein n=1 Tax=Tetrahymena thermophila (strain SB210) TaxID=312017 RepID=I7MEN0_TETTS|nr:kelch motif protein [Tetrahymena thermophila SB210]EAR97230.3 kelch motif protein [Tetrahymena thermophila SB210]|eukprot:XP_001017475.3 kelch motif protein [Tetrahymena thermophila SB210]